MRIDRLRVRSFRNIREAEIAPSRGLNWVFGENGQGKTNLLESLFVSLRGRSFRPYSSRVDWLPKETSGLPPLIQTDVSDERGYRFEARYAFNGRQWESHLGEKRAPVSKVRSLVPVVAFSPDDHALVRWEPDLRRDFLDEMFTDVCPGYAESTERFQIALKSRNRVLKAAGRETWSIVTRAEIEAWSETLAACAAEIWSFRRELWPVFERHFLEVAENLFSAKLELRYLPDFGGDVSHANCLSHILASADVDRETGWTHRGPHRDDFSVLIDGIEGRTGASQGQSRLIALTLKWTHARWVHRERDEVPIFLVDDFSSELDATRRLALLNFLASTKGQVFISGTEPSLIDSANFSDYNFYTVWRGVVSSHGPRPASGLGAMNV